ncbi:MAG: DUF4255 domain-containing protein [Methylobacter sp.]|nr:DUF4255 domain-containing protein [Candidatus Methylobacter titanis]
MSNSLAIATVTATLAALIQKSAQQAVGGAEVIIGRPQNTPPANTQRWVQLCLYQVMSNPALRNADLPTRNPAGKITQRPQVALDLHYLLAFYGDEKELEPQRMLGAVTRDLHANPVLLRKAVHDAIASRTELTDSNLDEAIEQIRLTSIPLNLDELSKLWSVFFQTPHALSIAYRASVVVIDTDDAVNPAPPVLQRGQNDQGVEALLGSLPRLEKIHISFTEDSESPERLPSLPNAWLGLLLTVQGQHLSGDTVTLRFSHPRLGTRNVDIPIDNRSDTKIRFELPNDAQAQTDWAAGLYTVTAIIEQAGTTRTTNQLSLPLTIKVNQIAPANPVVRIAGNASLTVTCSPEVLIEQSARLLLGDREVQAEPRLAANSPLEFMLENAPELTLQPVYVRVAGIDSLPLERKDNPPRFVFADNQKVTIT